MVKVYRKDEWTLILLIHSNSQIPYWKRIFNNICK